MLTRNENNAFSSTDITPLSAKELYSYSMCAVNAEFVYLTGGNSARVYANCHRYDINRNQWEEIPSMKQARRLHSSCQLAGFIYVFCGRNSDHDTINWVEKLCIDADPNVEV